MRFRCWQYWFCYRSGQVVPYQGPRLGQNTLSWPGSFSFSTTFTQPIRKLLPRLGEHKLYSVTKNWDPSSLQTNFSTQFRWRHQIHRRVEVKELEKGGGIFMTTVIWYGPWDTCSSPFQSLSELFRLLSWQPSTVMALVGVSFRVLI